jgi:hypothetical protein
MLNQQITLEILPLVISNSNPKEFLNEVLNILNFDGYYSF